MGFGSDRLAEMNPPVVLVSSSLMGQRRPYADFSGFGNLAAAITGFVEITGWPDRDPAGPFTAYTDYVSPRMAALIIIAAYDHAQRTGRGQQLDFSQAEASLQFLGPALLDCQMNSRRVTRQGNADRWCAPHGVYPAGEPGSDQWVALACTEDGQWAALARLLDRDDLGQLNTEQRLARSAELDAVISAWTAGREPDDLARVLQTAGVAALHGAALPTVWLILSSPTATTSPRQPTRNTVPRGSRGQT